MSLQAKFDKAVSIVQSLPKNGPIQPSQDDLLYFYRYYKQATIGNVNIARPGLMDFTGKAKWDAWKSVEGTSQEEAQRLYVAKLKEILEKVNDTESQKYLAEIDAAS